MLGLVGDPQCVLEGLAQLGVVEAPLWAVGAEERADEWFDVEVAKIIAAELGIDADDIEWIESTSDDPRGG